MADVGSIGINGVKYSLDPDPEKESYNELGQNYFYPENESDFWQTWEMRSFHGGERRTRILAKDHLDEMTYDDGEGIDVSSWGETKLQAALERLFTVSSSYLPMVTSNNGMVVIIGHGKVNDKYITTYSGTEFTGRATPNAAAVIDLVVGKDQDIYGLQGSVGGNRIIKSTNNGTSWSTDTNGVATSGQCQSSGNTTTTIHLAETASSEDDTYNGMPLIFTGGTGIGQTATVEDYDGATKIATITSVTTPADGTTYYEIHTLASPIEAKALAFCANQLYALGSDWLRYWDGAEWKEAADFGGDYCCAYGEQVYFARNNIIHRYNGVAAYEADRLPQGFVITGLYPYRNVLFITGYFYVQGGKKGAVYFIMDGRDAHLFNIGSYDGTSDFTVSAVAGSDDEVYFANQKRGGADRYDLTRGGLSSGPAWGSPGIIPFKSMAYSNGKLLIGRYDNNGSVDGVYVANVARPSTFCQEGWLTTPEYDWFFPHDIKVFNKIVVWHKALDEGESIQVEYSLDNGVTWHLVGVSDVVGAVYKEFKITNARSRSCKLKLTLKGDGTSTPTLTYVRVDAGPLGEPTSLWDVYLALYSKFQGRQRLRQLKEAYKSRSVLELEDLYGDKHAVIFEYLKISPIKGDEWTAKVFARLREV